MALILNIDTSTKNCSVCLAEDGNVLSIRENADAFNHAAILTQFIQQVLSSADRKIKDLDAVAISEGPGSYTGLRIGTSVAKGICFGNNIPFIAVNTLMSLAWAMKEKHQNKKYFISTMDSRKDEIYIAVYNSDLKAIHEPQPLNVKNFQNLNIPIIDAVIGGDGVEKVKSTAISTNLKVDNDLYFSSLNVSKLSFIKFRNKEYKNLIYFEPLYLKSVFTKQIKSLLIND